MGENTPVFLFLKQCCLAFLLYATWACQGRLLLDVEFLGGRGKSKGQLIPYFLDFLVYCTKTGEYKKSEDGEFPPTEGPHYIHPCS